MVFTYNIANGLTAGLVLHPLMKLAAGRRREVTPGGLVLAALCAGVLRRRPAALSADRK